MKTEPPRTKNEVAESGVPPPATVKIDWERKPVLYLPDGTVLVRPIGFTR